jgi:carbon-monoxide dehydrogenase medium subunit
VPAGVGRFAFAKFRSRAIDWAVVGVAAAATAAGVQVALVNMAATPVRAQAVEAALAAGATAAEAAQLADHGTEPPADTNASAGFRRHLARVLTGQVLAELEEGEAG